MNRFVTAFLRDLYHQFRVFAKIRQYIEEHEFRLSVKAVMVGAIVWGLTVLLRNAVHELLHYTFGLPELFDSNWIILLPLLFGALLMALLSKITDKQVPYIDDSDHVHELVMIGGNDNIKRIWALSQMAADAGQPTETGSANPARTSK